MTTITAGFSDIAWRLAIERAALEVAKIALGYATVNVGAPRSIGAGADLIGAHVRLVGAPSYELSLVATHTSCVELAGAVLGGLDASELPQETTSDAICELVNMLGGGIKRRLAGSDLTLGVPVFGAGIAEPPDRVRILAFPTQLGPVRGYIVVVGPCWAHDADAR